MPLWSAALSFVGCLWAIGVWRYRRYVARRRREMRQLYKALRDYPPISRLSQFDEKDCPAPPSPP